MNAIPDTSTTHQLLFAPYSKDYHVAEDISKRMTEEEFHNNCYVEPDFIHEADRIKESINQEVDYIDEADDGSGLIVRYDFIEIQKKLTDYKTSYEAFQNWIRDSGNGVYCIKGDAGTGKTTFLHHLEFENRKTDVKWEIIDLQNASESVKVLHFQDIIIKDFGALEKKVISVLVKKIMDTYFLETGDLDKFLAHLEELCSKYLHNNHVLFQTEEVRWFFDDAIFFKVSNTDITREMVQDFIKDLCGKIQKLINTEDTSVVIDRLLNVYMTFLKAMNSNAKHLIAFDNIERFIGVDEIFNSQIDSFVEHLRHISDAYLGQDKDFLKRFQFVILMRNTSSRMHNAPLQSIDFGGHELDLSDWFPVDLIISKKVDWYKNCGFSIKHGEIINSVIGENSFDGHGIRSLYEKLGSILNRDKRIIVNMLDRAISYSASANPVILSRFSEFLELEKKDTMPQGLTRFAARSIIMRIVLDVFREDNFFKLIRTQEKGTKNERLGYSRKILTVLYEFHLEYPQTAYMRFDDLIRKIIGNTYFDENNAYLRNTISSILFTMNYYNRRTNDWFRLIDIQHNLKSPGSETISDAAELNTLLSKHPDEVGLRIMEAGIGYLWYLVQSFEYFSCRYNNNNEYLPPLLCCIPSLNDLETKSVEQLECFNVITKVQDEAINCIEYMRKNENTDLLFKKRAGAKGMSHIQRIINSHTGYMGNFMEFVKQYYKQSELSPNQKATLDHLERKIGWVKEGYYKYSTQRPNRENSARH